MNEITIIALWKSFVWTVGGIIANLFAMCSLNAMQNKPLFKWNPRFFNFSTYEDMILSTAALFAWPSVIAMTCVASFMILWEHIKNAIRIFKE